MRLVQVAKILGMTGQQLRKELTTVDFGVKATDREIPDNLAHGIVRFVARKYGKNIDIDALMAAPMVDDDEEGGEAKPTEAAAPAKVVDPMAAVLPSVEEKQRRAESLHVLRKLTLDDVPRAAIQEQARQQKATELSKEERAERDREEKAQELARQKKRQGINQQEQIKKKDGQVMLPASISVKELAEKTGIQVPQVVATLMKNGVMATITQSIDFDTAAIVAAELGVKVVKEQSEASAEQLFSRNLDELIKDEPENLIPRPPIVVVMGHVDHGKTSILDAIRQTDVVSGEAGGITQSIGAYQIVTPSGKPVTFIDTPGHEAFTAMRARGAQVTDVVVLVVSAEEGIKETTKEAINHAKDAGVPIIVAINKIDKPAADPDRVKGELGAYELMPEEWGGKTPVVLCSAVTKQGIPELLDTILLVSEVEELKANPNRAAISTIIESHLDPSLGPLASAIVNTGTIRVGDAFICGSTMGRVRALMDARGQRLEEVGPSGAVRISGFDAVPQIGDILQVVPSERDARRLLDQYLDVAGSQQKRSFADLVTRLSEGKATQLKIVLKADTQGSLEAIKASLERQATGELSVKIIHGAIGALSESDVMMAAASDGIVIAFRVTVPQPVARTADHEGVQIRSYEVIYALLEEIDALLKGLLEPEEQENILGHLEVKGIFLTQKNEQLIGGRVADGVIKRVAFRLMRGGEQVGTGRITSLRKVDKDIKEAKEGTECGMRVESSVPVLEGDIVEAFNRELKRRE